MIRIAGAAVSTAALLVTTALPALANDVNVSIVGNGEDSDNRISFDFDKCLNINQSSRTNILNTISVNSNTGNNRANDNSKGDVAIRTGDATSAAAVSNAVAGNVLDFGGCACMEGAMQL